jgi:hypothetical protein
MHNLSGSNYQLYWIRFRTSTTPSKAPVAISFARGGNYRLAVLTSPFDTKPSFYVDSLGRTNIGGGNITGGNVFQINPYQNTPVTSGSKNSLVEFDSENSAISDLKLKLSANSSGDTGLILVNTRGTLLSPLDNQQGDGLGHIEFRGRFGSQGVLFSRIQSVFVGNGGNRDADLVYCTANNGILSEVMRNSSSGTTGFGVSSPAAVVHLKAGTTTIAPLKFTAGSLLSVPQVGAVEFDGHCFYFTVSGSTIRKTFASLESPQFSGNTNLPSTTCLNGQSLCNYILYSGGTNNSTLTTRALFNIYTGCSTQVRNIVLSGATNGISKTDCHNIVWGGTLTQDTVITGNTHNITISGKLLNLCGVNGIEIIDTSTQGIDINSNGNSVDIRGGTFAGVEKTKFLVSATQATFTDSRVSPNGIEYAADYSASYTDRSLVDNAYVKSIATGIIVKQVVELATVCAITLTGLIKVDGVQTTAGMRVLVKNQVSGAANGIYSASTGAWGRTPDFNGVAPDGTVANSDYMTVVSGNTNKNTSWILQTPNPISIGVTPLTFVLFSTLQGVAAGNGICITQSGGNNVIAIKLAGSCGLCSDNSGLYITPTIGGVGICFDGNSLCFNGAGVAGNSLSWTGTQLAVNTTGGTLNTALNSKLNITAFNTYSGQTLTNINTRALKTSVATYTGTTAPATYATKSSFTTYTGTTAPATYVCISNFNTYTGATHTCMDRHAYLSGATFTGAVRGVTPAANDSSTCFITSAWYFGQCATATPLVDSGSGAVGTSTLWAHQDHVHPIDTSRAAQTSLVTYTGTTAPATYELKTSINTYTGTTAPATYVCKTAINTYTGTTAPATYVCKTNFNTYTGATHTCMDRHAYLSGATFTGVVNVCKPAQNDNTNCAASTSWYISQGATALPLMDAAAGCGISNLFARQDHVHPKDSTKLSLSGGTMTGALVIDSNLTVTGTTILRGTTCLGTPAVGSIVTERTLFWNPTTCAVHAIKLTGGSDSYFYTEKTTTATIAAGVTVTPYLSGTPWTFLAGRYEIYFNAQFGNSAAGGTCLQFLCDNTIIGTRYLNGGQTGGWVSSASLSRDVTMTAGCHCLEIRFSRDANTACVTYGMIRAKRIC